MLLCEVISTYYTSAGAGILRIPRFATLGYDHSYPNFHRFPRSRHTKIENCQLGSRRTQTSCCFCWRTLWLVDRTSNKSITNLEYYCCRAKGIPIYAFVEKRFLAVLTLWTTNPHADFSTAADDSRGFEFVCKSERRSVWTLSLRRLKTSSSTSCPVRSLFSESVRLTAKLRRSAFRKLSKLKW